MRYLTLLAAVLLVGCKSEQKNRNNAYVPAAQQCVTDTDPQCVGAASAMMSVPLPEARDKSKPASENSIFGKCVMQIDGENEVRPCDGIQLVVRSTRENEEKEAVFDGYDFKFEGLNQHTYNLTANSQKYDLSTNALTTLTPGQKVDIKVKAKPKKKKSKKQRQQ